MLDKERHQILNDLIGKPWIANAKGPNAWDCYHLTRHVQKVLFNNDMPEIAVPREPTWTFIIHAIETHPERQAWEEIPVMQSNLLNVPDGSLVGMAASVRSAHLGTWFAKERSILHVDKPDGVVFQDVSTVRALGWQRLRFYSRITK